MRPKAPREPSRPLVTEADDLRTYGGPLWRVHTAGGPHPTRWDQLRTYGPLDSRWDPHPQPVADHPRHGVLYSATDPVTALGEVFWGTRLIDREDSHRHLTGWEPVRDVVLLDLTGLWAVRNAAAYALTQAPRSTCRAWARAIHEQVMSGDGAPIDGLWAPSTITGRPVAVLFVAALDAFPPAPRLSRPLAHDDLAVVIEWAAGELGYEVR